MAGPSAIGSVNGMPSSMTSAPASGNAFRIASEVSASGSPAVRNVTSAARPCAFKVAKRRSIRVSVMWRGPSTRLSQFAFAFAHCRHADVDGSKEHTDKCPNEIDPLFLLQDRTRHQKPHFQEIG